MVLSRLGVLLFYCFNRFLFSFQLPIFKTPHPCSSSLSSFFFLSPSIFDLTPLRNFIMGYKITNIYVITTVAVIGGALFGFDIASMSAM